MYILLNTINYYYRKLFNSRMENFNLDYIFLGITQRVIIESTKSYF